VYIYSHFFIASIIYALMLFSTKYASRIYAFLPSVRIVFTHSGISLPTWYRPMRIAACPYHPLWGVYGRNAMFPSTPYCKCYLYAKNPWNQWNPLL